MNDEIKEAVEQAANALQTAVVLSARLRQLIGEQADEAVHLEAAVARAAKALKRLQPDGR